jgi:hypothetical protein
MPIQRPKTKKPGYPVWNARLFESLPPTSPFPKAAHLKTRTVKKYLYLLSTAEEKLRLIQTQ